MKRTDCPRPDKLAHATKADALDWMARHYGARGLRSQRVYQCQCRRWHFTSQLTPPDDAAPTPRNAAPTPYTGGDDAGLGRGLRARERGGG